MLYHVKYSITLLILYYWYVNINNIQTMH